MGGKDAGKCADARLLRPSSLRHRPPPPPPRALRPKSSSNERPGDDRPGPRGTAGADPRGSERPDPGRRGDQRRPDPGRPADVAAGRRGRCAGDGDVAPRAPGGGKARPRVLPRAGGAPARRAARARREARRRLAGRARRGPRRDRALRERALPRGRDDGRRGAGAADGGAVRRLRDGRLRRRAPRPRLDLRRRPLRAGGLRRPAPRRRARSARQGPGATGAPARRGGRRIEGIDQARGAGSALGAGGSADHRRGHRQHLHRRRRPRGGRLAPRARPRRAGRPYP